MFSKLNLFDGSIAGAVPAMASPFGDEVVLEPVAGGTFGICYVGTVRGVRRFLKTHTASVHARANLEKEIGLLRYLEGETLHVEQLTMSDGRIWLVMDELQPSAGVVPSDIRDLTTRSSRKLEGYLNRQTVPADLNFTHLRNQSEKAFASLVAVNKIGPELIREIPSYFELVRRVESQMHLCLCHGDLGPRNLMSDGRRLIAVDWEDAFWGVEGYDYLYWLTFFENRRHLRTDSLGFTPWGKAVEIAIMISILVLKCSLSLRKGSYVTDSLTFDQRLNEVVVLA